MLLRLADGRTTFIDFRERAPEAASRNMCLDANRKATPMRCWGSAGFEAGVSSGGSPAPEPATQSFSITSRFSRNRTLGACRSEKPGCPAIPNPPSSAWP